MTTDADRSSFFIGLVIVDIFVGLADAISASLHRALSRRSGGLQPPFAERDPDRESAELHRFQHGVWRLDRQKNERSRRFCSRSPDPPIGYALLGFTTNFVALLVIAALPIAIGAAAFSQSSLSSSDASIRPALTRQSRHWGHARELVAGVGHRSRRRRRNRRRGRISRRLLSPAAPQARSPSRPSLSSERRRGSRRCRPRPSRRSRRMAARRSRSLSRRSPCFIPPCSWARSALPIVLTTSLGGVESDVGITMSLCAAMEIVVMGALIWRPLQRGERMVIVARLCGFHRLLRRA